MPASPEKESGSETGRKNLPSVIGYDFFEEKLKAIKNEIDSKDEGILDRVKRLEKIEEELEKRVEREVSSRIEEVNSLLAEAIFKNISDLTKEKVSISAADKVRELLQQNSEKSEKGIDSLRDRAQRTLDTASRARKNLPSYRAAQDLKKEIGDENFESCQIFSKRKSEIKEKLSNAQSLEILKEESGAVAKAAEQVVDEGVSLTELCQAVGAEHRQDDDADFKRMKIYKKYSERADTYLQAARIVYEAIPEPERLEEEAPEDEVVNKTFANLQIATEDQSLYRETTNKFNEVRRMAEKEEYTSTPAWGPELVRQELDYEFNDDFDAVQSHFGIYLHASDADFDSLSHREGAEEIEPGLIRINDTNSEDAQGIIYIVHKDIALAKTILKQEKSTVLSAFDKVGFYDDYREIIKTEVKQKVWEAIQSEEPEVVSEFIELVMIGVAASDSPAEIESRVKQAVDEGIKSRMDRIKVDLQRAFENPLRGRSTSSLSAEFTDAKASLWRAYGDTTALTVHLKKAGFDDKYIKIAEQQADDEITRNIKMLGRLEILLRKTLSVNSSADFQQQLFKRFGEVPSEKWETEIERASRIEAAK